MRAGKLRHSITIQQQGTTQDAYGGQSSATWTDFATVRASVEPLQGREYFAAQQNQAETTTRFRIRYLSGVTAVMRISYDGRLFDIESVINPNERGRELHIMAVEREA